MALAAAILTNGILCFNAWAYPRLHDVADAASPAFLAALGSAVYTAAIAPVLLFPLVRFKRIFGFRGQRSHAGSVTTMGISA